jgi:hypothetical protein
MNTGDLLNCTLAIAVPLVVEEYQSTPYRWESDREKIMGYAEVFCSQADELLFYQKGVSGELFCKLARTLAWLSFLPDGVRFNGVWYKTSDQLGVD